MGKTEITRALRGVETLLRGKRRGSTTLWVPKTLQAEHWAELWTELWATEVWFPRTTHCSALSEVERKDEYLCVKKRK